MLKRPAESVQRRQRTQVTQQGFSLLEMAIVMLILGILLSGVFVTIGSTLENTRRADTRAQLERISEALYAFAQTNGRLPCPAIVASQGMEQPNAFGGCTRYHGFVPYATLGIDGAINDDGMLIDAWQNPYRYSLAITDTPAAGYTDPVDVKRLYETSLALTGPHLRVCNNAGCTDIVESEYVPAVVLSMGSDWRDIATDSAEEQANAWGAADGIYPLTNNNNFVSLAYNGEAYDDMVVWLSPYVLFGRLITAGKLP